METILDAAHDESAFSEWPLRFVRLGGAQVTPDLIARAQALWGVPVLNGYGTTETPGLHLCRGIARNHSSQADLRWSRAPRLDASAFAMRTGRRSRPG